MSLDELMNNTTIQGDVKIRVFNAETGDELFMKLFTYVDDLACEVMPEEWEDLEVRYIYYADNCVNLELYKEEDE